MNEKLMLAFKQINGLKNNKYIIKIDILMTWMFYLFSGKIAMNKQSKLDKIASPISARRVQ